MSDDWLVDLDRPGSPPAGGPAGPATRPRARAAALALAAVAVLAVGLVALPRAEPAVVEVRRLSAAVLAGDVPSVGSGAAPAATLTVSVEVGTRPAGTTAVVTGLVGPGVVDSRVVPAGTDPAARAVQVSLDCRTYLADAPAGDLSLVLRTTDTSGHRGTARQAVDGSARSVGPVARRACWSAAAGAGLVVERVTARPGDGRRVDAVVVLRNGIGRDVTVTAVHPSDVDPPPDAHPLALAAGARAGLTVRLPVARCTTPVADDAVPASLVWAVGPAGGDPVTVADVRLDARQQETLRSAVGRSCGEPPAVEVDLVSAEVLDDPLIVDPRGRSVLLRLRVAPGQRRLVELGDHTGGLTADARPTFTGATAQVGSAPVVAELVWHTRCGGRPWPPSGAVVLPVRTTVRGLTYAWSVPLDGQVLGAALRPSCT
ncbi:hypothetical protein [Kineosporia sp. R_H_3]|uniref:hypothetical protein n=1 Tax=Kineosporia sp. R_H_3 TaxID=1961848 RepID=UPI000B4AF1FF|nr:hypothetical protein [Kineosporia sp. R_H_3]